MTEDITAVPEGYTKTSEGDVMPPMELVLDDFDKEGRIWKAAIPDLLVYERRQYPDDRGSYQELLRPEVVAKVLGRDVTFRQVSLSKNKPSGVLRGIHAEPMDKAVTLLEGKIFIALVDIRPDSPAFGKYVTFLLDRDDPEKPKKTIFIPRGCGNSFLTCGTQRVEYLYQMEHTWVSSEGKRSVKWDDPDLRIPWPIQPTIMSPADATGNKTLRELFPEKFK